MNLVETTEIPVSRPSDIFSAHKDSGRRYERRPCYEDVVVSLKKHGFYVRKISAKIVNHSENGACLKLPADISLPVGGKVRINPAKPRTGFLFDQGEARVARLQTSEEGTLCGVCFPKLAGERKAQYFAKVPKLRAAAAAVLLMALIVFLKERNIISFWYAPFWQIYSLLAASYVVSRILLSMLYKEPEDHGLIMPVSVVLSVKNEEEKIRRTVRSIYSSLYPAEKLQLLVVDDGSTDNTWEELRGAASEFPEMIIHRFEKNKGKRHGMAWGAQKATGDIIVFMDSDTVLEQESIYRIVQPFHDENVGAVAGHTEIEIENNNFISKMESMRYFVSQRVMKAAESVFGAVTCCPGPFSAYRREAVLKVLPGWLGQRFLGSAATFGDDRSLTNRVLRDYNVIYHAGARCVTSAPGNWMNFMKQQLRWKKSWVRETLSACLHMWREHPLAAIFYYLSVFITLTSPVAVVRAFLYSPLVLGVMACGPYLMGLALVFLLLGVLYYYHTQSRYWYYGLVFAAVYSWIFSIQTYYAMATVGRNHWGTR